MTQLCASFHGAARLSWSGGGSPYPVLRIVRPVNIDGEAVLTKFSGRPVVLTLLHILVSPIDGLISREVGEQKSVRCYPDYWSIFLMEPAIN